MNQVNNVPWIVTSSIVAVSTIIANLLFLVAFFKKATLRRRRTSLLLISLTAADLIVGTVAIPMYMANLWPGSEVGHSNTFVQSYNVIDIVFSFASLFGLAVIALERVYSVFWPYKHRSLSKTPYYVAALITWSFAALPATLILLRNGNMITPEEFFYFVSSCMIAVLIVITVSYSALWIKIKTTKNNVGHLRRTKREQKLAKTLTQLTGVFLVTWLPFYVMYTVYHLCVMYRGVVDIPHHVFLAAKSLHYSSSLSNPIVYSLRFPEVRRTLLNIFGGPGRRIPREFRMTVRRRGNRSINRADAGFAKPEAQDFQEELDQNNISTT